MLPRSLPAVLHCEDVQKPSTVSNSSNAIWEDHIAWMTSYFRVRSKNAERNSPVEGTLYNDTSVGQNISDFTVDWLCHNACRRCLYELAENKRSLIVSRQIALIESRRETCKYYLTWTSELTREDPWPGYSVFSWSSTRYLYEVSVREVCLMTDQLSKLVSDLSASRPLDQPPHKSTCDLQSQIRQWRKKSEILHKLVNDTSRDFFNDFGDTIWQHCLSLFYAGLQPLSTYLENMWNSKLSYPKRTGDDQHSWSETSFFGSRTSCKSQDSSCTPRLIRRPLGRRRAMLTFGLPAANLGGQPDTSFPSIQFPLVLSNGFHCSI